MKKSVLFVCMGNICRSPTGEGVFRHYVEERGLDEEIDVDSAGTIGYHAGDPADSRMRAAASKRGYSLTSRARQFTKLDFERFDLIIAMDSDNLRNIQALDSDGRYDDKVKMLGEFLEGDETPDVPDPYYGGARGFEVVLDMIEDSCEEILNHLLANGAEE